MPGVGLIIHPHTSHDQSNWDITVLVNNPFKESCYEKKKKKKGNVVIVIVLIANVTSPFVSESDEMVFRLFKIGLDYPLMGFQIGL